MMKTGKDGRKLSEYQQKLWMDQIGLKRRYLNQARGEKNGNAKLTWRNVLTIRNNYGHEGRKKACAYYGISERHWYLIRARKKWKHI